ncbi:MAG: 3'-5' exoribonuclease YhaM family protein [Tepidisphaerales bacterium]
MTLPMTMARKYLAQCRAGDVLHETLVVSNVQLAGTSNGKLYIKAFVSDRSAQMTARVWNASRTLFESLPDNSFQRVKGRVENFQNHLQLVIEQLEPPEPGTFDPRELLPTTSKDVRALYQTLLELMETLEHPPTRAIVQAFLDDEPLMEQFLRAPAATTFHHACIGGLIEHTLSMLEAAELLLPLYPQLSRDLVLAGIFLHDIAKTWELRYDSAFSYSDGGHLVGHVVKGAIWIEEKAAVAAEALGEPIAPALIDALQHIVLSHHGLPEHGAARPPMTPEALFVHLIDNLDAKMTMVLSATRPTGDRAVPPSGWTDYLRPFESRFFSPDPTRPAPPAPAPAPPTAPPPAPAPAPPPVPPEELSTATTETRTATAPASGPPAGPPEPVAAPSPRPQPSPTPNASAASPPRPSSPAPPPPSPSATPAGTPRFSPAPPAMRGPRIVQPPQPDPSGKLPPVTNPLFNHSEEPRR